MARGVKGTCKTFGDPCADCGAELVAANAVNRRPPRIGLQSYCRPCMNRRSREYAKKNPERKAAIQAAYRIRVRDQVLNAYGGQCACCGESHREFLAIDHVNGGGSRERRNGYSSTVQMAQKVIRENFPKTYRLLCHNCNLARGFYGYCPHERA